MLPPDLVIAVCLAYVAILFAVAFAGDLRARKRAGGWLYSPLVYTLSISIYCTSWTFFGAVGSAARNGMEFAAIYIGPTIVFVGWWIFLRKLVAVGRTNHTTSIADLISARFGKSPMLGAIVTMIAVVAIAPYIALQLKALTESFAVVTYPGGAVAAANINLQPDYAIGFWIAAGLCLFSIMFGVRKIDVNERHHGVIAAIAVEAMVKLIALIVLGLWVVFGFSNDPGAALAEISVQLRPSEDSFGARWISLCFLAGAAVICLPRQFQVTVVENSSERQLRTASWLFPGYLFAISLFVPVIAAAGSAALPAGSDPDFFVLALPLSRNENVIGLLTLLGGFSSATSMVIVSSIALSTMLSNHIVMPLVLRFSLRDASARRVRALILTVRRISVVLIIYCGFFYFLLSGTSGALAAIGLISFCGVAQFLPCIVGGLYWRRATQAGAMAGLIAGFLVWGYTLFLPSFGGFALMPTHVIDQGPFGIEWLRPHGLFGLDSMDPLVHALAWSMLLNVAFFVGVSVIVGPSPLARVQSTLFVDLFAHEDETELHVIRRTARLPELRRLAERILGPAEALELFSQAGTPTEIAGDELISRVEQRLASNIGAASARSLITNVVTSETIGVEELKRLASEAEQIRIYSAEVERKSRQLERVAAQLGEANVRLRQLDVQKDDFLSQVSHELRTPMSSIRSFSDILLKHRELAEEKKIRYLGIIQDESLRLTRLLDSILHLNRMEDGGQPWDMAPFDPDSALEQALGSCEALAESAGVRLVRASRAGGATIVGDRDKLAQVFVNLIANAIQYNTHPQPEVVVSSRLENGAYLASVADNGPGIAPADRERIFEKFARGSTSRNLGTGLGLSISRQIVERHGGELRLDEGPSRGARFTLRFPLSIP